MFELFIGIVIGVGCAIAIGIYKYHEWEASVRDKQYENRMRQAQGQPTIHIDPFPRPIGLMAVAFSVPVVLSFLLACFTIVSAGHMGVQVTMGTVNPEPLSEGVHFVNPISRIKIGRAHV